MKMFHKVFGRAGKPQIDTRKFAIAPFFSGDDFGAFYDVLGRGGRPIARIFQIQEPAHYQITQTLVNSSSAGYLLAGSYTSQPLAQQSQNTNQNG